MNEQRINEIKDAWREIMQLLISRGQPLSNELKIKITQVLEHSTNRIQQLREEESQKVNETPQTIENEIPVESISENINVTPSSSAQLMWILAGQNEDAFLNYIATYPDPALKALLNNPIQLQKTIDYLNETMPPGNLGRADNIEHADLNSSNIYGFKYDPQRKRLFVKFQGDGVYGYEGVPPEVFKAFQMGAIPAKTDGQNEYGKWWKGKKPSLGASFYQLIKQGAYPYHKLS